MQTEVEKRGNIIIKHKAKLRNNAIFAKSIENPMNKVYVKIVTARKQYLKGLFRPTCKREKKEWSVMECNCNEAISIEKV